MWDWHPEDTLIMKSNRFWSRPLYQVFHYSLETVTAFLVPFSIMTFCYLRIAHTLASSRTHWHHRSYRKTNRLITLIVVTFALLWAPYHLVNILQVGIYITKGLEYLCK